MDFTLIIHHLRKRLSDSQVVISDLEREAYSHDRSPYFGPVSLDFIILFPHSESDVEFILKTSDFFNIPIVVRGAGTGTTGGALPVTACLMMSFEKMDRILEIDVENRVAVIEPGVITGNLQREVSEIGLFYPPDPASLETCTIGGNVAENAGGPRCLKYGVTRDYILGLSGFYVDGTPFHFGGKLRKDVAGYDMIGLLVGSEGTLAVITQIIVKLIALPLEGPLIHCAFTSYDEAFFALNSILTSGVSPSAVEFMDTACLKAIKTCHGIDIQDSDHPAHLLIELDSHDAEQFKKDTEIILDILNRSQSSVQVMSSASEKEILWKTRRLISRSLKQLFPQKISHDIVVPVSRVSTYMAFISQLSIESGIQIIGYGHLGDGNIHVNILIPPDCEDAHIGEILTLQILEQAILLKGSITGEHGIGVTKKPFLNLMFSEYDITIFRGIKRTFDPKNLLNPHKIID